MISGFLCAVCVSNAHMCDRDTPELNKHVCDTVAPTHTHTECTQYWMYSSMSLQRDLRCVFSPNFKHLCVSVVGEEPELFLCQMFWHFACSTQVSGSQPAGRDPNKGPWDEIRLNARSIVVHINTSHEQRYHWISFTTVWALKFMFQLGNDNLTK